MMQLSQHVDRVVNWLKWPVAVVAVLLGAAASAWYFELLTFSP